MKDIIANIVRLTMEKAGLHREAAMFERATSSPCHIPMYTLADVSEHCTPNDCWLIICDKVYDVTDFLKEHPGGDDIILEYAGRDGTVAFHGTGHSSDTIREMEQYCIGMLVENERLNMYTEETPPIPVAVVA